MAQGMEPQLAALIHLAGPQGLIGEYLLHELPGSGRKLWARVIDVDHASGKFWLEDARGELLHRLVDKSELSIGIGTRYPQDTLLTRLSEFGLRHDIFEVAIPGAPPGAPLGQMGHADQAQQPPQGQQIPEQQPARRVRIPDPPAVTPGAAVINALTPGFMREADLAGGAARLERAFKEFVQKGSLISHMEAALRKIPRDSPAWHTKLEQLFEIYKEPDPKVAHLMAAVYFYANQINFVSLDLEYLADGFVSDMKLALEEAGDSSAWSAETVRDLEKKIKKTYEEYRKEAAEQVGEGHARPNVVRGAGGTDPAAPAKAPVGGASEALRIASAMIEEIATIALRQIDQAVAFFFVSETAAAAQPKLTFLNLARGTSPDQKANETAGTRPEPPQKAGGTGAPERVSPRIRCETVSGRQGEALLTTSPGGNAPCPAEPDDKPQTPAHKEGTSLPKPPAQPPSPESIAPEMEQDESEPDLVSDPLVRGSATVLQNCSHQFFMGLKVRSAATPDKEQLRKAMRETLDLAPGPKTGEEMTQEQKAEIEDWLKNVGAHAYDPDQFVAGSFERHLPAWEEMLKDSKRESSKRVLKMLRSGVRPQFVGTDEADTKKREQVQSMLARTVGAAEVDAMLTGQVPHPVEFDNHRSFYDNSEFAVGEVVKMVVNRTLEVYGPSDGKPKVVNPLGVVNLPKGRLVVNARYVNLFSKRQAFKYETLREVLTFLTERGFFTTWDFKAGYYHLLIHPAYRKYFGIKVGHVYMHYNGMCFGWSEACFVYTLLTQEAAKELRLRSIPISSYLDDGLTGTLDFWRCAWSTVLVVKTLTLLGAVFSLPKCNLWPQQEGPWLGFVIDTIRQRFAVSPAKMEKLRTALRELAECAEVTPRLLARVAGKVISVSPAVLPAALYSRPFFAAIQAPRRVERVPAQRWYPRSIAVEAGSDALESGFGGTIKIPGKEKLTVAGALSDEEKRMSSTAREMVAFLRVLTEARARAGDALQGAAVLLLGDNQGAVRAVNAMNSRAPDVNEAVRQLFELCVEADFDIIAQWRPRAEMQEEDDLSKHQDSSDWGLGDSEVRRVLSHFGVEPAIDLFGSETWHVTERFVSLHLAPGAQAADAMRTDWSELLAPGDVAWVFPPVRLLSDVIQAVRRYRTDCVIIVPEAPATNWWMALQNIGTEACMTGPLELPRSASICTPSFRVPQGTVNPAMYKLRAFGIRW
ncbi:putative Reverse transcriptase [Klebsormidium nitens]|uniref:Putative Reverse transcriptase n=1 Tax=Klebsormidium nitens TaxID=105231 RepID=A0A1Y1I1K0_KLENI|nr:putative Reverse transcriptase [Klebsormidium nitens]|eukprot:GAQ82637.1 putative Reverse transcriptase [Klebsormidium nitens]